MVPKKETGKKLTFLLTEEARTLLAELAKKQGINMTSYLEVLIRKEAKDQGVKKIADDIMTHVDKAIRRKIGD